MAEGLIVGAVVAQAYTDLYKVAKDAVSKIVWCKKHCKNLAQDLDTHLPTFRQICLHVQMPAREWDQRLLDFKEQLEQGRTLVESCFQLRGWHPIQRLRYSLAILKLRKQILQQLQNLAAFNTLLLQQLHAHQHVVLEEQHKLRKAVDSLLATMEGRNISLLLDWVRQANSTGTHDAAQTNKEPEKRLDDLPVGQFLVGLDNQIDEVKSLLFSGEEKTVTIVGGMGGIGKTTLVLAICKDPQVREFFHDGIHVFTVSQSPDVMGLLSTIWQEVVGGVVPVFQNEEDAYRQLKGRLLRMPSNRLLVLDDVWSKANLENLSFEVKNSRTLITSRQASILETHNSHIYTLGLLCEDNAQSLFCYWAFGQDTIPEWADKTLVNEVISECKCLPLALKVIGGSLSNVRFPIAWRNARDKLREAEPLGEYQKDVLQRRLQTSIDALDLKLQECFVDLGAYPEDSQCSVDSLLDIWVYVRGMEWMDAVLALAELGSRGLLDFNYKLYFSGDGSALEYGSAPALFFSQHDVMRDLALYLGRKNHPPSQRTWLLMPQKERSIPMNWQSVEPLAAQIISISTGAMMEQDWPPALAFPFAEALLLNFDGKAYHLPPFVQSMCKLKVLFIRSSKRLKSITLSGSLEGLSQLQSIDMENIALITPDTTPKLERLRLKARDVAGALSILQLPGRCCQLRSLQILSLFRCYKLYKLPKELGNMTNLVCLCLRSCHGLRALPASLCKLQCLEFLDMSSCDRVVELPEKLGQLNALKELCLKSCYGLRNLPESLGNLSNLKMLDLHKCLELRQLPRTFGQLVALKKLDLGACMHLQGLPENFGMLRSLEDLSLAACSEVKQLPQNFGLLSNLKRLDLSKCSQLKHLPESFVQLSSLETLILHSSEIEMLPPNFGKLTCLKLLSLEDC